MSTPRAVYLVGFMGAGKSAVGERVAERTGRELVDTDRLVERQDGRPIARIFAESGEPRFRELERAVLERLSARSGLVVAAGGGLFLSRENRRRIRDHGLSVWLDVDLPTAVARVGRDAARPLWDPADPIRFRALFERRRAVYALADRRVDASGAAPEEVAERILRWIPGVFR